MKPICCLVLLSVAAVCSADDKPPLERDSVELPVVKMPLGKFPAPWKAPDAPLLDKGQRTATHIAVEGQFEMADKDYKPFEIFLKIRAKTKNGGWATAMSSRGGKPVKVKKGVYRYRTVIKTPPTSRVYYFEIYADPRGPDYELITRARVDIDVDFE